MVPQREIIHGLIQRTAGVALLAQILDLPFFQQRLPRAGQPWQRYLHRGTKANSPSKNSCHAAFFRFLVLCQLGHYSSTMMSRSTSTAGGLGSGGGGCGRGFPVGGRLNDFRGDRSGFTVPFFTGGQQAVRILARTIFSISVGHLRVLFQEVLLALSRPWPRRDIAVAEPGAALLDNAQLDAQVENLARFWRCPCRYMMSNSASRKGGATLFLTTFARVRLPMTSPPFFSCLDPAHVQAHGGVELQRAAAGGGLWVAVHHADLLAQLVDEDGHGTWILLITPVSLRRAWLIRRACRPTWLSPISPSISALGTSGRHRVHDHDIDGAGAHQRLGRSPGPARRCPAGETSRLSMSTPSAAWRRRGPGHAPRR